jgi:hypothetical protein
MTALSLCVLEIQMLTYVPNVYLDRQTESVAVSIALDEKSVNVIWHLCNDFITMELPAATFIMW